MTTMVSHNKTLRIMVSKLGLIDKNVINKAAEFERLLQAKYIAGSNISDTSKMVICLDLAASMFSTDFDMKTAMKYSGLKPSMYAHTKKVLENLLELGTNKLSTSVLCVTLQCTEVQALADQILAEYQKQTKMQLDLMLPQYACMAVYQSCRINKVKVAKSKFTEKSRLKPGQWAKLEAEWTKFVDVQFASAKKKSGRQAKAVTDDVETKEKMDVDSPVEVLSEPQVEPYEEWKSRMLRTAYKELKQLEKQTKQAMTPRRSPRKTPQKYSPYKNSTKPVNGVRLLFPVNLR